MDSDAEEEISYINKYDAAESVRGQWEVLIHRLEQSLIPGSEFVGSPNNSFQKMRSMWNIDGGVGKLLNTKLELTAHIYNTFRPNLEYVPPLEYYFNQMLVKIHSRVTILNDKAHIKKESELLYILSSVHVIFCHFCKGKPVEWGTYVRCGFCLEWFCRRCDIPHHEVAKAQFGHHN